MGFPQTDYRGASSASPSEKTSPPGRRNGRHGRHHIWVSYSFSALVCAGARSSSGTFCSSPSSDSPS
eukprot:1263925-Pyramimonas_sp.AAC.1